MDAAAATWNEDAVDRSVKAANVFSEVLCLWFILRELLFATHLFMLLLTISQQVYLGTKEGEDEAR